MRRGFVGAIVAVITILGMSWVDVEGQ